MSIKEENLIKYEGTLKAGQRLVKVGNTFMPVGVGGAFELGIADTSAFESDMTALIGEDANIPPVLISGIKLYKCASVDTANKTWSGYEAYQDEKGFWNFADTVTNLIYGNYYVPSSGVIYDATASVMVSSLFENMVTPNTVFLLQKSISDTSGNNIPVENHGLNVTSDGIVYAQGAYAVIPAGSLPENVLCDNREWTIEIRLRFTNPQSYKASGIFGNGLYDAGMNSASRFDMLCSSSVFGIGSFNAIDIPNESPDTNWHVWKVAHTSDNVFTNYLDGETRSMSKTGFNLRAYNVYIGWEGGDSSRYGDPCEIDYIRISNVII